MTTNINRSTNRLVASSMLLLSSAVFVVVLAEKDSDYYYPGFVNPNTQRKMYWKDSVNVLEDLGQFDSLYIKYHHCVWSKYGSRYGTGEDYDEEGEDEDQDGDMAWRNGCGGFGGEYYWYMGRTQCFRANVAYSLYGILKEDVDDDDDDDDTGESNKCKRSTYINSFFTTFGVESFGGPLGLDISTANSMCTQQKPDNDNGDDNNNKDDNGDYNYAAADDDYVDPDDYQFYDYARYSSYGIGCSAEGTFVQDKYQGAFCHGSNYIMTMDAMESFNEAIESHECTQIYDSSNNYNNNKDRRLSEDDYEFYGMSPINILSYSKSCSRRQYPNECPDPYGFKRKYAHQLERALTFKKGNVKEFERITVETVTYLSFLASAILLIGSIYITKNPTSRIVGSGSRKSRKNASLLSTLSNRSSKGGTAETTADAFFNRDRKQPIVSSWVDDDATANSEFDDEQQQKSSSTTTKTAIEMTARVPSYKNQDDDNESTNSFDPTTGLESFAQRSMSVLKVNVLERIDSTIKSFSTPEGQEIEKIEKVVEEKEEEVEEESPNMDDSFQYSHVECQVESKKNKGTGLGLVRSFKKNLGCTSAEAVENP